MQPKIHKVNLQFDEGYVLRAAYARPNKGLVVVVDNYPVSSRRLVNGQTPETRILHLDSRFGIEKSYPIKGIFYSSPQVRVGTNGHAAVIFGFSENSNAFNRPKTVRSEMIYTFNASGEFVQKLEIGGDGLDISLAPYITQQGQVWIKTQSDSSYAANSNNYNDKAPLERWTPGKPSEGPGRDILLTRISGVIKGEHESYRVGTDGMDLSSGGRLVDDEEVFLLHGRSELNKPILVNAEQISFLNSPTRGFNQYFIRFNDGGVKEGFYLDPKDPKTYVNSAPTNNSFRDPATGFSYCLARRIDTHATNHSEAIGSFYVPREQALEAITLEQMSSQSVDQVYRLADEFYSTTPHHFKLHGTEFELEGSGGLSANSYGNYFVVGSLKSISGSDLTTGVDLLSIKFESSSNLDDSQRFAFIVVKNNDNKIMVRVEDTSGEYGDLRRSVDIEKTGTEEADYMNGSAQSNVKEYFEGGAGDDVLMGRQGGDVLSGGSGNDLIKAGHGRDVITGGVGGDTLFGGFGHNIFTGEKDGEVDTLSFKSDQHLWNWLYGKSGNNADGSKLDVIHSLDAIDKIRIEGVVTSQLSFEAIDNFSTSTGNYSGVGFYADGFLEAIYTGGDLSTSQLKSMTVGVDV